MTETRDERAARLTRIGMEIAVRIRDEDPADVRRLVDALPADERADLAILGWAHVPVDLPRSVLIGWWTHPPDRAAAAAAAEWIASEYQRVEGT